MSINHILNQLTRIKSPLDNIMSGHLRSILNRSPYHALSNSPAFSHFNRINELTASSILSSNPTISAAIQNHSTDLFKGLWNDRISNLLPNINTLSFPEIMKSSFADYGTLLGVQALGSTTVGNAALSDMIRKIIGPNYQLPSLGNLGVTNNFNPIGYNPNIYKDTFESLRNSTLDSIQNLLDLTSQHTAAADNSENEQHSEFTDAEVDEDELANNSKLDAKEIDQQISEALDTGEIADDISPAALSILQRILKYVLLAIVSGVIGGAIGIAMTEQWQAYKLSNKDKITQMQMQFPAECLRRCRIANRNGTKIFDAPSRKSDIIYRPEKGDLLFVVAKSGKSWVQVQVKNIETNESYTGWIMNSYTAKLRI
ncbi:MAG: SH3 domain-containing protein [Algicola sp.]|nr:SH3 domain-containing protein [Algicola sp.]